MSAIKTILDTISADYLPVKFSYLESQPATLPAGCILSNGFVEEPYDGVFNEVQENFIIRLIYPQNETESGYAKWLTLADLISAEFRKKTHLTLDGQAISILVKQGLPPSFSTEFVQPVVIFDLLIEVKILKSTL